RARRRRGEDPLLLEDADLFETHAERLFLGVERSLLRLARADVGGDRLALMLQRLEVRRGRHALVDEAADAALVRGDGRELRAQLLDLLKPCAVARLDLRDLPLDVGGVLGE